MLTKRGEGYLRALSDEKNVAAAEQQ